jgi:hypothetical protein
LDRGLRERTIVYGYWAFCAAFGALTLLVDQRLTKLVALLGLALLGLVVLVWASRSPTARHLKSQNCHSERSEESPSSGALAGKGGDSSLRSE